MQAKIQTSSKAALETMKKEAEKKETESGIKNKKEEDEKDVIT